MLIYLFRFTLLKNPFWMDQLYIFRRMLMLSFLFSKRWKLMCSFTLYMLQKFPGTTRWERSMLCLMRRNRGNTSCSLHVLTPFQPPSGSQSFSFLARALGNFQTSWIYIFRYKSLSSVHFCVVVVPSSSEMTSTPCWRHVWWVNRMS